MEQVKTQQVKTQQAVSYRSREEYMTESGARIEAWTKSGEVTMDVGDDYDPSTVEEDLKREKLFYGIMMVMTPVGPKEIKFFIPDVNSIEEAMQAYPEAVDQVIGQLEEQRKEAMKQEQSQIVQAPAGALNELDNMPAGGPKIHLP